MERRWPSNMVVAQDRSFSIMPAQIFAAAAASLIGPTTNLSCMPSPLLLSLMTMIGRNVVSAAFDLDLRSPRHSARKPGSEFAPPTSIPNSVRWTANLGAADAESDSAASSAGAGLGSGGGAAVTGGFSAAGAVVALVVPTADTAGPGDDFWAAAGISGGAVACGDVTVEFCRVIAGAVVAVVAVS